MRDEAAAVPSRLTCRQIIALTADDFELDANDLIGPWRDRRCVEARQAAIWLIRQSLPVSLPAIGRVFGGRDHSTILYSIRQMDRRRARCLEWRRRTDSLLMLCAERMPDRWMAVETGAEETGHAG